MRDEARSGADDNPAGDIPMIGGAKIKCGLSHRGRRFAEGNDPMGTRSRRVVARERPIKRFAGKCRWVGRGDRCREDLAGVCGKRRRHVVTVFRPDFSATS